MTFTYNEFLFLCESFQILNHFDFNDSDITANLEDGRTVYTCEGMYRDENNYKTHVVLIFDGEAITWTIADGWDDANDELNALYDSLLLVKGGAHNGSSTV